ncbi:MAG: type II toxin-antitoxin system RelE/ParE family toxin [Magnetospirillum sp.]|nr:type II toxin-antitoxin system RelE/ParE family toxin [Magnetospirillum sp.]
MSALRYQLTRQADADVMDILRETERQFGPRQRDAYADIIAKAAEMVAESPERPASRPRPDLAEGVRSLHLDHAAGRLGAAAHILYYLQGRLSNGETGTIVVRILHERMDPLRHV